MIFLKRSGYEKIGSDESLFHSEIRKWKKLVRSKNSCRIIGLVGVIVVCVILVVFVVFKNISNKFGNAETISFSYETLYGMYSHAAIIANAPPCATISKEILLKGGNAIDGIIAAMLCDGVTVPQSMGIGGGFFMIIYNKKFNNFSTVIARETAPAAATSDMFHQNPELSQKGGLSIAIPGEIKGYWEIYKKFGGGVSWKELFAPTISLCEHGIPINKRLADILVEYEEMIKTDEEFKKLFVNSETGSLLEEGESYTNMKIAKTLKTIAEHGGDVLYEGPLAAAMVQDIRKNGGIITEDDLRNFSVVIEDPFEARIFNNFTLFTINPPSSGAVLAYIFRILNGLLPTSNELLYTQRCTEAFKYGYGARTKLGDPRFVDTNQVIDTILSDDFVRSIRNNISDNRTWNDPLHYGGDFIKRKDSGTANLAIFTENGDAVVATSTINLIFGSGVLSKNTGIILNNQMDDFSSANLSNAFDVDPSRANFIEPGKRPLSSMTPSIVMDSNGDVKLLIGAAGGTKIITAVAITAVRALVLNENLRDAMDRVFFHHQLLPMLWQHYPEISKDVVRGMKKIGHKVQKISRTSFAAVNAILKREKILHSSCDRKRMGHIDGY